MADGAVTPGRRDFEYRPHLDGLRAVAVYLVVLFHAGVFRFRGGFIGVDVFFVLSGFLVTALLVGELRTSGRVSLLGFYARRARRLLPAAGAVLVATAWLYSLVANPLEQAEAAPGLRWAALYVSNWWFISESADYFGTEVASSPVAHYWSLSVEEQFYILWPLALLGLWWLCSRFREEPTRLVRSLVAMIGLASLTAAIVIGRTDVDRAYYGTDTRAYQLLAGALLALTPGLAALIGRTRARRASPWISAGALVALVVLGSSLLDMSPITRGVIVAGVTVALLLTLDGAEGGPTRWLLSRPALVYLGRVSYGTYLWHWPVLIVIDRTLTLTPLQTVLMAAPLATGLASASYHLLEMPIRTSRPLGSVRLRPLVVGIGLAMSLLVGLLVAPELLTGGSGARAETSHGSQEVTAAADHLSARTDRFDYSRCPDEGHVLCALHEEPGGTRVLLVGDSHAGVMAGPFTELAESHHLDLRAGFLPYCPWTWGVRYNGAGRTCFEDQTRLYETLLPEFDPEIVILAHRAVDDPADPIVIGTSDGAVDDPEKQEVLAESIGLVVEDLRADGRMVVIVEPVPLASPDSDPTVCLADGVVEPCRFLAPRSPVGEEETIRSISADDEGVIALNLDPFVCPYMPICDPVVDGMVVRSDTHHLTMTFATSLADEIEVLLFEAGVIGA